MEKEFSDALVRLQLSGLQAYLLSDKPVHILGGRQITESIMGVKLRSDPFSIRYEDQLRTWIAQTMLRQTPVTWSVDELEEAVTLIVKCYTIRRDFFESSSMRSESFHKLQHAGFKVEYREDRDGQVVATKVSQQDEQPDLWFSICQKGMMYIVLSPIREHTVLPIFKTEDLSKAISYIIWVESRKLERESLE